MAVDSILVHCRSCDAMLEEDPHRQGEHRVPCPHCGSLLRRFDVKMSDTVTLKSKVTAKGRRPGQARPFIEQTVGDDLRRKTGRWMRLHRIIDRLKDWYHERVTDPATGEVVRECEEPLSAHTGHGSAKPDPTRNGGVDA